jgi:preprotein translocase subunit SecG
MGLMQVIVLVIHVLAGLGVIGLVLLQHGKGADMGAAFGGGSSGSLFGATGSANFMSRATGVLATTFFCTSLALAYLATSQPKVSRSVMDSAVNKTVPGPSSAAPTAPAVTSPPDAASQPGVPVPVSPASKVNDIPR